MEGTTVTLVRAKTRAGWRNASCVGLSSSRPKAYLFMVSLAAPKRGKRLAVQEPLWSPSSLAVVTEGLLRDPQPPGDKFVAAHAPPTTHVFLLSVDAAPFPHPKGSVYRPRSVAFKE